MRCGRCKRFAKVVEAIAVPFGEGYGFSYRPKVTVECRTHGRIEADQNYAWEDVFGDSCPDSDPERWTPVDETPAGSSGEPHG
jgi:hypothetical protein